jgi:glycosyltransferase involved in cell wall biosynthesis
MPPTNRKSIHDAEILIAGPARNIAAHIAHEIDGLYQAMCGFKCTHGLVVESDSTDDTVQELAALKGRLPNFNYISFGRLVDQIPMRTARLAYVRNRIITEVKTNPQYAKIDFIAMADLDGINRHITVDAISQCWDVSENWDVITANQLNCYYDVWTLRHPDWSPVDCLEQMQKLEPIVGKLAAQNLAVQAKQVQLSAHQGMIEVDSAFGGLGIYSRAAFLAGRYRGVNAADQEESDHLAFHTDLRKQGYRIYINPALINSAHHLDPPPPPLAKKHTFLIIRAIQWLGRLLFGHRRFNKYLDLLKIN